MSDYCIACDLRPPTEGLHCGPCSRGVEAKVASGFNRKAWEIVTLIRALTRLANDFLGEHDESCECVYCAHYVEEAGWFVDDLQGILWALRVAEGCMSSELHGDPDIRARLAAMTAAIEATVADDADEPLVACR